MLFRHADDRLPDVESPQPQISAKDLEPSSWDEFADGLSLVTDESLALTDRAEKQVPGNPYPDPAKMWDQLCPLGDAAAEWRRRDGAVKVDDFVDPGRCGRIRFGIDQDGLRFVVDHIGLHR